MKLSVIVPTYNEGENILQCVTSLLEQKYPEFEIIVVDDGSTDKTQELLSKMSKRITVLCAAHKGAGEARNLGAKHATGDILVFVDADMTFDKVFLKKLVAPIVRGVTIGTFSKNEYVLNWNNVWARSWNWNLDLPDRLRIPRDTPLEQKVFRAILKKEFDRVHGFTKGGYTDDWSLSEKLHKNATHADGARFYHANPDSLREVFVQARWSAQRPYKLGTVGSFIALVRVNILFSLIQGIRKSILHREPRFLLFKIVYDGGVFMGVLLFMFLKKGSK